MNSYIYDTLIGKVNSCYNNTIVSYHSCWYNILIVTSLANFMALGESNEVIIQYKMSIEYVH